MQELIAHKAHLATRQAWDQPMNVSPVSPGTTVPPRDTWSPMINVMQVITALGDLLRPIQWLRPMGMCVLWDITALRELQSWYHVLKEHTNRAQVSGLNVWTNGRGMGKRACIDTVYWIGIYAHLWMVSIMIMALFVYRQSAVQTSFLYTLRLSFDTW